MKSLGFFFVLASLSCSVGEEFGKSPSWMQPLGGEERTDDSQTVHTWSVEVDTGATYRLRAMEDGAVVLAASPPRTSVTRFNADGVRVWTTELPELSGDAPVEMGALRSGHTVIAGSPNDGSDGLVVLTLSTLGRAQLRYFIHPDDGRLEARGVAWHYDGAIAVLAVELVHDRVVRTVIEVIDETGKHVREAFSDPGTPIAILADSYAFTAVGDLGEDGLGTPRSWVRGYGTDGVLTDARVLRLETTGVWTRRIYGTEDEEVWLSGMIDRDTACLMPAFDDSTWSEIEETPAGDPVAITSDGEVLSLEDGAVTFFPGEAEQYEFLPDIGTARMVAAGALEGDPTYALSRDEVTWRTRLHRLDVP